MLLTEPQETIYEVLVEAHGDPVSQNTLAAMIGRDNRHVRQVVKELIEVHGLPIGSSSRQGHGGYYLIRTDAQRALAMAECASRLNSLTTRLRCLAEAVL